jgi:hypothetical protein
MSEQEQCVAAEIMLLEAEAKIAQLSKQVLALKAENQRRLGDTLNEAIKISKRRFKQRDAVFDSTIKERDEARAEVERVRKLWNESHIAERDDFAKEETRLKAELTEAIRERNKTVADLIKQRDEERAYNQFCHKIDAIRPEPSRLEIAAMIMAAVSSRRDCIEWQTKEETIWALDGADALIAAAKETK